MTHIVATEFTSQPDHTVLVRLHTSEKQTLSLVLQSASTGPIVTALLGAAKDSARESAAVQAQAEKSTQHISVLPSGFRVTSDIRPQHQTLTFEFGHSCIHLDIPDADARQLAEMLMLMVGKPVSALC